MAQQFFKIIIGNWILGSSINDGSENIVFLTNFPLFLKEKVSRILEFTPPQKSVTSFMDDPNFFRIILKCNENNFHCIDLNFKMCGIFNGVWFGKIWTWMIWVNFKYKGDLINNFYHETQFFLHVRINRFPILRNSISVSIIVKLFFHFLK